MPIKNKNVDAAAAIATSKIAEDSGITSSHIGSSKVLAGNVASSAVLDRHLSANLRKGIIPIDIFTAREIVAAEMASAALSSGTTPTLNVLSSLGGSSKPCAVLQWAGGNTDVLQFAPIPIPPDYSTVNSSMTLFLNCGRGASTDSARTWKAWFAASTAVLSTTSFTPSSDTDPFSTSVALTAGALPGYPGVLTLRLSPGASTSDTARLFGAWIEYTRNSTA